jgi:asparagine synthase (glutamine-hydrolysing)
LKNLDPYGKSAAKKNVYRLNSMANSIETRVPYIDHIFVEAVLKLRPEDKIHEGFTKYGLREIADQISPPEIAWRRDKITFEAPTNLWLRKFYPKMEEAISKSNILECICSVTPNVKVISSNVAWRLYNIDLWELQYYPLKFQILH